MKLDSQIDSPVLPRPDQTTVLELGLQSCTLSDWLAIDADLPQFHAHKLEQFETHKHEVFAALPESEPAQAEFGQVLLADLLRTHGERYHCDNKFLRARNSGLKWSLTELSLDACSLWIQEDICLMQQFGGEHILTAASLCSPTNWRLNEKIGHNLNVIHDPVPGYGTKLQERVNRMLSQMSDNKLILRYNWSLQQGSELCWRPDLHAIDPADQLFWRVERQTLRRLPQTGAIVFGIRIYLESLAQLETRAPGSRNSIRKLIANLDSQQRAYKGLDSLLALV